MDYIVVWLDANIFNEVYRNRIMQLRQTIDLVKLFTEPDESIDFITQLDCKKKVFMIISNDLGEQIVHRIENIPQLQSIYVFCDDQSNDGLWTKPCTKVRGIYNQIMNICHSLNYEIRRYNDCFTTMNNISLTGASIHDLNELDQSFMYSQLLKEAFLKIEDGDRVKEMKELLTYLRDQYADNNSQLTSIAEFEKDYNSDLSIKWYTKARFIYHTLNTALRTQDIDIIVKMGFFIRDIHRQIVQLHSTSADFVPSIVYRGQSMLNTEFEKLKKSKGSLLAFNNFLSTSVNQQVSPIFAHTDQQVASITGIIFEIEIDRSVSCSSFGVLGNLSHFQEEEEILFSMNTVFRIGDMESINDRLWRVKLILTSDTDEQLKHVTDSLRQEIGEGTGRQQLGRLMIMLDQTDKAEEIYSELLKYATSDNWRELAVLYNQLESVNAAKSNYTAALSFFKKTADIENKFLVSDHLDLAVTYNNIAETYHSMKNYPMALDFHQKAQEICQMGSPSNDTQLAVNYNNIGTVYKSMGEYQTARLKYQQAVKIGEKSLAPNHPKLATIYENLASLHTLLCEYPEALSFYQKALIINKKTLPPSHTLVLATYNNIVSAYTSMGNYSDALRLYERELKDPLQSLPENHSLIAVVYSNIGLVYLEMGKYSEAYSFCEKALEIQQKNDVFNNLDMVTTYSNIGHINRTEKKFMEALSFYDKARHIEESCLPTDHPSLATTYNDLGDLYRELKKYAEAREYLQKSRAIRQKCLRPDHPSLASVYNNIGMCHQEETGDYKTSISWYEKAVEINRKSPPSNNRNLAINYNNIGNAYYSMKNYSAALDFFQKTLEIEQNSLSPEHPDLAYTYNNMAYALEGLQRYQEAFNYFMKSYS